MTYVHYRDVAEVAAKAFVTDRFSYGTFELAAPGMYTRHHLAELISDLLGRPVTAEAPTFDDWADQFQLPSGPLRDGLHTMNEHYDQHGFHGGNPLVLATMLGRQPLTVPAYLKELTRP